jgi:Ca2+-dependent lipid-binding protein
VQVHKTEVISNNLHPHWEPFSIPLESLAGGDPVDCQLVFDCFDYDSTSSNDLIGSFKVVVSATSLTNLKVSLLGLFSTPKHELVNPSKQMQKGYKNSGIIEIVACKLVEQIGVKASEQAPPAALQALKSLKQSDMIRFANFQPT